MRRWRLIILWSVELDGEDFVVELAFNAARVKCQILSDQNLHLHYCKALGYDVVMWRYRCGLKDVGVRWSRSNYRVYF